MNVLSTRYNMQFPNNSGPPIIVEVHVLHVEPKSSRRVIMREELLEDVEPLSSHDELLSEIEKQKNYS